MQILNTYEVERKLGLESSFGHLCNFFTLFLISTTAKQEEKIKVVNEINLCKYDLLRAHLLHFIM